jgi:hypothetical protein
VTSARSAAGCRNEVDFFHEPTGGSVDGTADRGHGVCGDAGPAASIDSVQEHVGIVWPEEPLIPGIRQALHLF